MSYLKNFMIINSLLINKIAKNKKKMENDKLFIHSDTATTTTKHKWGTVFPS